MGSPIYTVQIIKNLYDNICSIATRLKSNVEKAPDGRIEHRFQNGKFRFFRHIKGKPKEYLGEGKEQEIQGLIQKKLDLELLKITLKEKSVLEQALNGLDQKTREQAWKDFPELYKKYVQVDESLNEGYIKKWKSRWGLTQKDDKHKFLTTKGDYVISKSEYIIAEELYKANIPYHYEILLKMDYGSYKTRPDFYVLNPRTLKEYYWEHFGMMDDETYFTGAKVKLDNYANVGKFPGKDLILTFETAKSPLSIEHVKRLIEEYLT